MLVHDTSTYRCFFCSTVRIRFPFKESKVVADVGDSVSLVCSAQGFPLNVIWKKNQAGSSAVIKRKTIYATINLGPVLTTAFSKVCLFFVVIENASIDLRPQYRFYAISTVGTKTLKNDRIARRDVSWTPCESYSKHTCLRYFRSSLSVRCVFDCSHWNEVYAFSFDPLSRAFSNRYVFDENAQRISVDGRPKRIEMYAASNENALMWRGTLATSFGFIKLSNWFQLNKTERMLNFLPFILHSRRKQQT